MDESTLRLRHPDTLGQAFLWALFPTLVLFLSPPSVGNAQVTTSITSTTGTGDLGTTVTHTGNLYDITGGTRPGDGPNLFHSFGDFSVGSGDIAHFLNTPVNGFLPVTSNILGRVTGGNLSNIDGTIQTTGFGNANLFLVNPSGIVFGPHGSVNVGGSVSFTTAQYLRLFDSLSGLSANFYANPANDGLANSVLAVAPLADFGFLFANPNAYGFLTAPDPSAAITLQGNTLAVAPSDDPGSAISLIGGKVVIQGASLPDGTVQPAVLLAPSRTIQIATTASPGEVDVATLQSLPNVDGATFTSSAFVTLAPGSSLGVTGGSSVFIKGGQLVYSINDATLNTTTGLAPPDTISLSPGSFIVTSNSGTELGAETQITVGTLQLDGAVVATINDGDGGGGNISINATTVGLTNGSTITAQTFGVGHGGRVAITSESLTMEGGAVIDVGARNEGRGGDIVLSVHQKASLSGGAAIRSHADLSSPLEGASGRITIQGRDLALAGPGTGIFSSSFGEGHLGDIRVHAKTVSLTDRAVIQAGTPIDTGTAGDVIIEANSVGLSGGSRIASQAFVQDAGQMTITANRMTLDHASIETGSHGLGRGGDMVLNVGAVSLANRAAIDSSTSGTGRAGDVTMTVGNLTLANHAVITSSSLSPEPNAGNASNVTITSSGSFTSDASTIVTSALNAKGGDIKVTAQSVALSNGTSISASSTSPPLPDGGGDAGNITIQSGSTVTMHNSVMTAEAGLASGGQLVIITPEMLWLTNSRISTSVFGGNFASSGGNITIDPQFVILQNSQILAQAFAGPNGNINIIAGTFLVDPNSVVNASGQLSISGSILPLGGQLTPLSQQFSSAAALLFTQRCAADPTGQFSSFVQTGRDGVPQVPGALSPSPLSFLETLTSGSLGSPGPNWVATRLGLDSINFDDSTRFHSACRS